jgi:hypothetical protein
MASTLADAFQECSRRGSGGGRASVQDMKDMLTAVLTKSIDEKHTLKIMQVLDTSNSESLPEHKVVDAFTKKLDRIVQDERDAAFLAKREAATAKLAAQKAEAVAAVVGDRPPTVADRWLAGLPYLLPLLDALPYGVVALAAAGVDPTLLDTLLKSYRAMPFSGLVAFFALNALTSTLRLHRLVRFSILQAILMDLALFPVTLVSALLSLLASAGGFSFPEGLTSGARAGLFVVYLCASLYGTTAAWAGVEAGRVPFVSERVKARIPTTNEFRAMFDEDGNFKPPAQANLQQIIGTVTM